MLAAPRPDLQPNSLDYERLALVKPTGFREYDARWLFGREINGLGIEALGLGLGTYLHERGIRPHVVTGHDFRSYSGAVKQALTLGLMASGCTVHDIGLALSPIAYFAQSALDVPAVAFVTASHNENGWTGVKMGCERPLTFGPDEMARLKEIVLSGAWALRAGGGLVHVDDMGERYLADLASGGRLAHRLKLVCACGNGTAGAFAPQLLEAIGCDVVRLDCDLDHSFPRYNPNPEDTVMLAAMGEAVRAAGADLGVGFDGDGDRCGIVDNEGRPIFADKVGLLLARDLSARHDNALFLADVKSTSLFAADPVLAANGARTEYWKTGHSYMERRSAELGALAAFEKSGHYFFSPPIGRGYDDGLLAAVLICRMLDRAAPKTIAELYRELPETWGSPTLTAVCADEAKYGAVERLARDIQRLAAEGGKLAGQPIRELITLNGIRIVLKDGTWGVVRASSNKPELVIVAESPTSEEMLAAMLKAIEFELSKLAGVGPLGQAHK
jgi:phosphomannomutase/phosphoglucomutase